MGSSLSIRMILCSLFLVFLLSPAPASACRDKNDCSGGEICCFGNMGGRDNLNWGGKGAQGYCAKAKACAMDDGTSVIYNDGSKCPPGQSIKTRKLSNGAEVKGCFN